MPYICRKPFTFMGHRYEPGEEIVDYPTAYNKAEAFTRNGFIVLVPEQAVEETVVAPVETPKKRSRKPTLVTAEG